MDYRLTNNDKFFLMLILLDIIEVYNLETSPNMRYEMKYAVNKAIKASRNLTNIVSKYIGPIENEFGFVADEFQNVLENMYKTEKIKHV